MTRIKFDVDGVGVEASEGAKIYDGPPPPRGVYPVQVNYAAFKTIKKEGPNKGKKRMTVIFQITEGKYKGASIFDGFNMTTEGIPYVNAFLHAFTDGSPAQKLKMETAMWKNGPIVNDKGEVLQIGPVKFKSEKADDTDFKRPTLTVGSLLKKNVQTKEPEAQVAQYINKKDAKDRGDGTSADDANLDDAVDEDQLPEADDADTVDADAWDEGGSEDGSDGDADADGDGDTEEPF